ncbi:hypothetical protein SRIMM317S_02181 [Streptomyces rimosus subsp. rimosus]
MPETVPRTRTETGYATSRSAVLVPIGGGAARRPAGRPGAPDAPNLTERGHCMPAIPVTVLGPQESGKTVYLASLFRRLSIQRDDVGFFVRLPSEEATKLNQIFGQIISPDGWPNPNLLAHTSEWRFTCSVRTEDGRVFSPFTISYLDYAGEHLTRATAAETEHGASFWQRVQESEFLLVLLDGVKVLRCFEGDFLLVHELISVFNAIESGNNVVHFVVTKWDLLEAAGHSVRSVLDCLLKDRDFSDFYLNRLRQQEAGALRFIPVSSLGRGFAVPAADGRTMVKQGTSPQPLNVEVPLMAVLVDLFNRAVRSVATPAPASDDETLRFRSRRLRWLQAVQRKIPMVRALLAARAAESPVMAAVQEYLGDTVVAYVDERLSAYGQQVENDVAEARGRVLRARSEREAMIKMVDILETTLAEFDAAHTRMAHVPGRGLVMTGGGTPRSQEVWPFAITRSVNTRFPYRRRAGIPRPVCRPAPPARGRGGRRCRRTSTSICGNTGTTERSLSGCSTASCICWARTSARTVNSPCTSYRRTPLVEGVVCRDRPSGATGELFERRSGGTAPNRCGSSSPRTPERTPCTPVSRSRRCSTTVRRCVSRKNRCRWRGMCRRPFRAAAIRPPPRGMSDATAYASALRENGLRRAGRVTAVRVLRLLGPALIAAGSRRSTPPTRWRPGSRHP